MKEKLKNKSFCY